MAGEKEQNSEKPERLNKVPEAEFVEDIDSYMTKGKLDAQEVLRKLDEQLSKYKFMESHLNAALKKLKGQTPELKSCLQIISEMKSRKEEQEEMDTQFLLSDQVYVKATIPPSNKICLWLGANVMLEYELDEAESLLSKNLNNAETKRTQLIHDIDFMRTQTTITEVMIARVYNWDVRRRRSEAAKSATTNKKA